MPPSQAHVGGEGGHGFVDDALGEDGEGHRDELGAAAVAEGLEPRGLVSGAIGGVVFREDKGGKKRNKKRNKREKK